MTAKPSPSMLETWQRYVPLKPGIERHIRSVTPLARRFVFDQDHERYMCRKCTTLRTWRKSHYRGDATKGIKTKVYEVQE